LKNIEDKAEARKRPNNQISQSRLPEWQYPIAGPDLNGRELEYVTECIKTGWISGNGQFVIRFEEAFAKFCDAKFGIAVANGTAALHLALLAKGVGQGDEVIVPSLTFIATANAVKYTGATPVFVDSTSSTWTLDPEKIESLVTARTRAIIPVHLYGHPADMDPILEIAEKYGLAVIEDSAEAHGAEYKGRIVGGIGDIGTFSFFGNKIISTGEGGMIVTNNKQSAEKLRLLRDHGMSKTRRFWHPVLGYNYRLTNIQAAIGLAQLERIDDILNEKIRIAECYNKELNPVDGILLPPKQRWAKSVYWLYSVVLSRDCRLSREELIQHLDKNGVESRSFFYSIHKQPIYDCSKTLPISENLSDRGLSLPSSSELGNQDIAFIARLIRDAIA